MTQSISGYPLFNAEGTPEDVMDYLGSLETDEIAALFAASGIKGRPRNPLDCPVANFVRTVTDVGWVSVGMEFYAYGDVIGQVFRSTPPSVGRFIVRFDDSRYPELMELIADANPIDWSAA